MPDPTDADVCICGHRESRHGAVVPGCRGKGCDCPSFANERVVERTAMWLEGQHDLLRIVRARIRKARHA